MHDTKWLITCLLLLGCLVAVPAHAVPLHVHDVQAKSPFDVRHDKHDGEERGGHGHALHCALMGHDINTPCPHYRQTRAEGEEFTLPCHDGAPPASISGSSGLPVFTGASFQWDPVFPEKFHLFVNLPVYSLEAAFTLEHPPRLI